MFLKKRTRFILNMNNKQLDKLVRDKVNEASEKNRVSLLDFITKSISVVGKTVANFGFKVFGVLGYVISSLTLIYLLSKEGSITEDSIVISLLIKPFAYWLWFSLLAFVLWVITKAFRFGADIRDKLDKIK